MFSNIKQGSNELNEKLLKLINTDGRIHLVPGKIRDMYFIRFAVCASSTESSDITLAWNIVKELATSLLEEENSDVSTNDSNLSPEGINGEK